jgi:DNA-binding MarR family transcriptional regulator
MIVEFKTGRSPSSRFERAQHQRRQPTAAVEILRRHLIWWITIIEYNLKADKRGRVSTYRDFKPHAMTVSKTAFADGAGTRKEAVEGSGEGSALQLGELSELLGYSLKRAQLKIFEDFLRCVAPLQLTPAQFSVLLLLDKNPGRNQTEIANTLGILRPNFVAMLDGLESRDLCTRVRSTNDRRSHVLLLTDKGKAVLARAKKLVATKHEARLNELLGAANRAALLAMLTKIAQEF